MRSTYVLLVLALSLMGCQNSKDAPSLSEVEQLVNYSGPSEASEWRLEDKREIVTPCTIGGTPLATFNLPLDTVEVLNAYTADGYVVVLARWSTNNVCRFVRMRPLGGDGFVGYEAEILGGQVLHYGVRVKYDIVNFSNAWLTEYTMDDILEVAIQDQGAAGVAESYSFNGAEAVTFQRDADPMVYNMESLAEQVSGTPPPTIDSVIGAGSTLYYNVEGERLVSLLESHDFAQWTYNLATTGDLVVSTQRWGLTDWLTGCTAIKCLAGGIANPVCATCTVVSGGLWLAKAVVCGIGHCDDWPPGL